MIRYKIGDRVKVVKKESNYECGWVSSMDDFIGKIGGN